MYNIYFPHQQKTHSHKANKTGRQIKQQQDKLNLSIFITKSKTKSVL